jgi:hypothetical protein
VVRREVMWISFYCVLYNTSFTNSVGDLVEIVVVDLSRTLDLGFEKAFYLKFREREEWSVLNCMLYTAATIKVTSLVYWRMFRELGGRSLGKALDLR